jgi:hypothetical protein
VVKTATPGSVGAAGASFAGKFQTATTQHVPSASSETESFIIVLLSATAFTVCCDRQRTGLRLTAICAPERPAHQQAHAGGAVMSD